MRLAVICCSFYNGNYFSIDVQTDFRPNSFFQFAPRYTYTFIDLPTGSVGIHLATFDFIVNFTPDMQLFTQAQFDNISQNSLSRCASGGVPAGRRIVHFHRQAR
jgi:hypothetical protein